MPKVGLGQNERTFPKVRDCRWMTLSGHSTLIAGGASSAEERVVLGEYLVL